MSTTEIIVEEELYPWQGQFLGINDGGEIIVVPNFNFAKCGTKAGKTAGCALGLTIRMINIPNSRWLWTAPVNKQLDPTWSRYFRPLIDSIPKHMVDVRDAYGMWRVTLKPNNSTIMLKSGDEPWNLRGDAYHGAVIDEAALYQLESYFSVLTNLTETAGTLWAISTPKAQIKRGGQTWFDSGFAEGLRQQVAIESGTLLPEDATHTAIRVPTWSNPKPEIQKWVAMIKKMAEDGTLPGGMMHFRREYGAEDVEGDTAVFRHVETLHRLQPEDYSEGCTYAIGWDPAAKRDASVISVWNATRKYEVHLEYMMGVAFENQMERVKHLWLKYRKPRGKVDATAMGGELVMQELRKQKINLSPVIFSSNSEKIQYVQTLALAMEREEPKFLNNAIAKSEMEAYGFEVMPSGIVKYGAPSGQRDDIVTARMLAWMQVHTGGVQVF